MDSIANDSSYTDAQRANARIASAWLSGNAAAGINKADWFDQYVDNDGTHNTSSFSFEQLKNALTYMDTLNNIRKANGLGELSVSLKQTAAAVLQVNYSAHTGLHAQHYSNAENLSSTLDYAYTGGETIDTLGDPYTGWYTEEKRVWDEKVASDPSYEQYKTHAYLLYMSDPSFYSQVGHYLNIIHPDYVAMGFGVGNGKGDNVGACVINDFSFDSSDCDFSVADFKKLVNDYIDSAYGADVTQEQKNQLAQLESKLTKAQKDFGAKRDTYWVKVNESSSAYEDYKAADNAMNTAKGEYENARAATTTAKGTYDAAKSKLDASGIDIDALQQNLNTAKAVAATAQATLADANSKLTECQTNASKASTRKLNAQSGYDAAKAKSEKAKKAYDDATASVKDLTAKLDAARTESDQANEAYGKAKAADVTAQAGVNDAEAAATAAATALSNAQQEVTNKEQALAAAQQEVKSAKAALATANKAFEPYAAAQKALDDAEVAYRTADASVNTAKNQLDAANQAVEDAKKAIADAQTELAADQALQADLDHVDHEASLAAGVTVFNAGWTAQNQLPKLDAAYARYKAAVDAAAGLKAALSDADAKLSDANDAYAAALAELNDAKGALAAAQAEYDKYHPKAEPQAKPQVAQAAAKAPAAKKQAADGALAQTGDNSALAGEVFVIGGITLVAAGVTLGDRRRKQM